MASLISKYKQKIGGPVARALDHLIKSLALYRLSYTGLADSVNGNGALNTMLDNNLGIAVMGIYRLIMT